jgi:hypothetical protein
MAKKRKVGRPSGRRPVFAFRVRVPLHKAIKKLASQSGRSMSAEAEHILEKAIFGHDSSRAVEQSQ